MFTVMNATEGGKAEEWFLLGWRRYTTFLWATFYFSRKKWYDIFYVTKFIMYKFQSYTNTLNQLKH